VQSSKISLQDSRIKISGLTIENSGEKDRKERGEQGGCKAERS
jgi:hypothetical protein